MSALPIDSVGCVGGPQRRPPNTSFSRLTESMGSPGKSRSGACPGVFSLGDEASAGVFHGLSNTRIPPRVQWGD